MKIAITTNTTSAGGAEKQRILLANELTAVGHEVVLVVLQEHGSLQDLIAPAVKVELIGFKGVVSEYVDVVLSGTTNTELMFAFLTKSRRRAGRWVVAVHNPVSRNAPHLKRVSRGLVRLANARIALTDAHRDALSKYWGLNAEFVIPNASMSAGQRRATVTREKASERIGYLGRLDIKHKGLDRLLAAMTQPEASSLTLDVAGTGPDEKNIQEQIDALGLGNRVALRGFMNASEFLNEVSGLVLLSRWEAQPMVLIEASEAGVPVLMSLEVSPDRGVDADNASEVARRLCDLAAGRISTDLHRVREPAAMAADYYTVFASVTSSMNRRRRR